MLRSGFDPANKKTVDVLGASMAYLEHGEGDPIVLIHGNPTSSFLWRHVIPPLAGLGRCIAPDLIGMGASAQVDSGPSAYRFAFHREYLDGFLDAVGVEDAVTLVVHDWGGALGFDWARRNADKVRGIAYTETLVTGLSWDDWPESSRRLFQALRSPAGEEMILDKNIFVERVLPASVLQPMSDEVLEVYREPYRQPGESRRPTLTWAREIPIDGAPEDVAKVVSAYRDWLAGSDVPKLFINADPGFLVTGRVRELCRSFKNQNEVTLPGYHFIQEDSGEAVGYAIAGWMGSL